MVAAATAVGRKGSTVRSTFSSLRQVQQAMEAKLAASLLTTKDARQLQFAAYTADEVARKFAGLPVARAGFSIPYFDLEGRTTKFQRFRYLEYGAADGGFAALTAANAKPLRYGQREGSLNELYLPPFIDWQAYALEKDKPLLITEGELKAACATKHGLPTIGLGGVWCFKSNANHMPLLPAFQSFYWKERRVYIVYDSDAASNHQVVTAENALARELMLLGAVPMIARLPVQEDGTKCGLDDYIVSKGADSLMKDILEPAQPWRAAQELFALNEEVVYVKDPGIILKLDNLQRLAPRAFVDHAYAPRIYFEEQATANGVKLVERSAAKEWVKWPQRATVERVTYCPGQPRITEGCLNVWPGWAVEPEQGDIMPWTLLLDYLFHDSPVADRQWFEQWLAYPLQFPGEKLYSAAVFWGIHHGTGKSLVGYTMLRIYGRNATEIGDRDLHSTHNEWAENKQFVMGDEITGGDKRNAADRMKSMITQKQLRLNPKYVPSYTVPDCINYYFTSNHPDAFFLEDTDRRFFIHEVKGRPMDVTFYRDYMDWVNELGGAARLFHHLLNLDTRTFDPQGHAPITLSKMEMIDSGRSDVGTWAAALREDPDRILQVAGAKLPYKLYTSEELRAIYDPAGNTRVTANGLGRELRRAGFNKVYQGMGVVTATAGRQRLWAVRDAERLLGMRGPMLGKLYDDERKQPIKGGGKF